MYIQFRLSGVLGFYDFCLTCSLIKGNYEITFLVFADKFISVLKRNVYFAIQIVIEILNIS